MVRVIGNERVLTSIDHTWDSFFFQITMSAMILWKRVMQATKLKGSLSNVEIYARHEHRYLCH